jgi:hypothetical protein
MEKIMNFLNLRLAALVSLLFLNTALITNCAHHKVVGSGLIKPKPRTVREFKEIELHADGIMHIQQGAFDSLTIQADDNILEDVESKVEDRCLKITTKPGVQISPTQPITYNVTVQDLNKLTVVGSAKVFVSNIDSASLTVNLHNNSNVTISGKTLRQTINIEDSGIYDAKKLTSQETTANIQNQGQAYVNVSNHIEANVKDDGRLEYVGKIPAAKINKTILDKGVFLNKARF